MKKILVTGPSGFLGYHVIKLLTQRGFRPRALLLDERDQQQPALDNLKKLEPELVSGQLDDVTSLVAACQDVDTVLHLKFAIALGSGKEVEESLHRVNVVGTRNVLDAAARAGVGRVVVSSSALTVGLNRQPQPLDETADWDTHRLDLAYILSRRQAEQEALARPQNEAPVVCAVNPSFTMGPEDYVGAPANKLVMNMTKWWFRFNAPIGFGVLDVRDYADGVLRAAEKGRHGQRYILSGENVMPDQLKRMVAEAVKRTPPRFLLSIRAWMAYPLFATLEMFGWLRRKPPKVTRDLLQLWGRHAWYDTSLARNELGWRPHPLRDTLNATIDWMSANAKK